MESQQQPTGPPRRNVGELTLDELKHLLGEKEILRESMLLRIVEGEQYITELEARLVALGGKPALQVLDGGGQSATATTANPPSDEPSPA